LARHPADGLAAGHAAQALFARRDERAVAVAAQALALRPRNSGLHRLAARMLMAGHHPAQAQVEFRLALAWCDDHEALDILDEIVALFPDPTEAARALPIEERQAWRLQKLLGYRGRTELALAYAARVLDYEPNRADAHLDLAQAAMRLGKFALAREHAEVAYRAAPTTQSALVLARAQAATASPGAAVETLRSAPPTPDGTLSAEVAAELAAQLRAIGDVDGARAVLLDAIDAAASPELEAILRRHYAELEEAAGNRNRAAFERQKADELAPPTGG
ncbi:MAG TPA: hypothetical protein VHE35_33015, partial [Kofleriaceae bacterium]|nr:hypothetical protein [Kofleriaceae bacterium]